MSTVEPDSITVAKIQVGLQAGAAENPVLIIPVRHRPEDQDVWQQVLDHQLVEWGTDPGRLADEAIVPPAAVTVRLACQVATALSASGRAAPLRVVPTGDGGIVFEWKAGTALEMIEIQPDGSVELASFDNARLRFRRRLA